MPRVRTTLTPEEQWEKAQQTLRPGETEADRLAFMDCLAELGQYTTFTEDGQPAAILPHVPNYPAGSPKQMALEAEWEERCQQMHQGQRTITLADKPEESHYDRHSGTLERGD